MENTNTMNEMNKMDNVNTNTNTMKEEGKDMKKLTEERKAEIIERLKEVNIDNYYTDDTIEELYEITAGLDLEDLEYDFENVWEAETAFEYLKEVEDLDAMIYILADCSPGAKYYRYNGYGNFEDWTAKSLGWLVSDIIMTIEQAE